MAIASTRESCPPAEAIRQLSAPPGEWRSPTRFGKSDVDIAGDSSTFVAPATWDKPTAIRNVAERVGNASLGPPEIDIKKVKKAGWTIGTDNEHTGLATASRQWER